MIPGMPEAFVAGIVAPVLVANLGVVLWRTFLRGMK